MIFGSILTSSRQSTSKYWVFPCCSSWNRKFLGIHWSPACGSLNCWQTGICYTILWIFKLRDLSTNDYFTFSLSFQPPSWFLDAWLGFQDAWLGFLQFLQSWSRTPLEVTALLSGLIGMRKESQLLLGRRKAQKQNCTWGKRAVLSLETIPRAHSSLDVCSFLHYRCKHQCLVLVFIPGKCQ